MKKILSGILAIGIATTSSLGYDYYENQYDDRYGYEKYKVISSTPITKTVSKNIRIGDEIRERTVRQRVPCANERETNTIGLDTIIGTTLGVVVGNQIGKGNGRDAAKIIGGLSGGYMANQMRNQGNDCFKDEIVYDRVPKYETITEQIITGYNNCVEVDGKKLCKESKKKKRFLKVKKIYSIY